jgi:predicted DNA-binding transcriptional regulator YafY
MIFMPVNKNALIRYKTIDNCLKNPYRRWTLDDLIDACSDALYEFEGVRKGISKRTIQMDIQLMRSEKLGYNAPIVVYDNKYYKYDDPDYSITNLPLTEQDLNKMSEAVEVLRQFKQFTHFSDMSDVVSKLESHLAAMKRKSPAVINFEKNDDLKGLEHLDFIYQAILNKQTIKINYKSFKARHVSKIIFYPYLLKEYRNRWFVFGVKKHGLDLLNLALDRFTKVKLADDEPFVENTFFEPESFFDDIVGVTKRLNSQPEIVRFIANPQSAPYIETKPIHKSQRIVERRGDGSVLFELNVVINHELQRDLFAFSDGITVVQPKHLVDYMSEKFKQACLNYETSIEPD